jgi:D-psicose/D-tagatose/L-ribulose 3-epimerase
MYLGECKMIKVGIYYAYWTHEWDADFHPYIDKVADLGFDILEVNGGTIANLSSEERKSLKLHAADRKIELTYCIGLPAKYDIASPDNATRKTGIVFLQQQASAIGEMGGGKLSGIIYSSWPATMPTGETDKRPYMDRSIESMKEAIKSAEHNNVFFNMEVVNRFEQYLLNTSAEAVDYVKQVNSPNAKILLDTFHMNIEEENISTAITTAGKYLGHVHLGENNRTPPGSGHGHIPWAELGGALKEINYQGTMVMEPFLMPGGQVGRDIKVFRDLSIGVDLDEEARKACVFMRKVLAEAGI